MDAAGRALPGVVQPEVRHLGRPEPDRHGARGIVLTVFCVGGKFELRELSESNSRPGYFSSAEGARDSRLSAELEK